ncbi:MAG: HEAT repeat domain-containing protein [Planctomycetaceae bacterium]
MTSDFAEDDDDESDVRLVDDSNDSAADLGFFNSISEIGSDNEYDDDDDRSELEFASNGSQASMSLSGMLAAPEIPAQSSGRMTRPAAQHFNNGSRPSAIPGHTKFGLPEPGQPSFPFSAYDTATAMGNTPGLSMPLMPMMHPAAMSANGTYPPAMHPGMMSAAPAFDMTSSSPLIPAFTSSATEPVSFTATTSAAGKAGAEVSSTVHQSSTTSGVTQVGLPGDDEQSIDEIEAAKALATAAHEKALARLSAAREDAFRKLLEDAEEIPKTLPRLLKKRISTLMATPSTKMDRIIEQLHELGATNSPAALSTLASFCHKPAKQIREACAHAIGCIAHAGSAVLLLKLFADKSGTVVEAALEALTRLDLEPTRPVLLAAGLCGTSLRTVVTVGIEATSDDKKSKWETLLLEVLRGDDTNSAAFAVSLLARIAGDTYLEIFQKLASHNAPVLRAAAVEALARTQAKRAISQINDALEDADPTVRAQAAMSVATMYSPRSVELLQKLVFDSNLTVRRNAAQSMSRIDESDLADVIAKALDQETDATTVEYLLAALQRNGASSSLPILQRYIEGDSSQFREQAVKALRKLKITASVPVFRRLLDDHTPALRRQAIEQLAVLKSEGILPRLREMLKQDPDETVRSACAKALGDFGDETSVHLLEEALEDHPLVRLQAVIALGRLGQSSAGPILLSLLRDQLPEVRYQAVRGIGLLKLEGAVEQVEPLLDDSDELVRRGAEQTLTDLGVRTGNRKARQWKRRLSAVAGWIAPSTIAGLVPGGAKTLFAVILLLASSVGMFAFKGILMAASGEQFEIEPPISMSVSSSGENILVVRQFGVSEVWNLKSGKLACRQSLPGRITGGIFVDDASLLINQDGKMVAYDFLGTTLKEAGPKLILPEQITHTVLHRQTKNLFVAYLKENRAHLASYNLQTMQLQSDRILSKIPGGQMTVSLDSSFVASMSGATVLVYDLKNDEVGEFSFSDLTGGANGGEVLSMCFSDDMKFLAISQSSYGVAVIEMATTSVKAKLEPKDSFGYAFVRFAPGTHNLVAVSTGGKVIVSSKEFASTEEFNIEGCRSAIDMFSVSDDNQQVAVASTEELDVFIGDAVTGKISHQLVAVDDE